jgi:hypothetical protein
VRSYGVAGIDAGALWIARTSPAAPPESRRRSPGLAVDPGGTQAVVVGSAAVVRVDLRSGAQAWRSLRDRALADGGRLVAGSYRRAEWLGPHAVAVSGWDDRIAGRGTKRRQVSTAAGLALVDPATLTARTIDPRTSQFSRGGRLVLGTDAIVGEGVTAYRPDGRRIYHTLGRTPLGQLPGTGRSIYIGLSDDYRRHAVRIVDTRTGGIVRTVLVPGMVTLLSDQSPSICWC